MTETTASRPRKGQAKQRILEALARMLEHAPGGRITTAALAQEVGVTEAALYRHFPSKTRMFEGLIDFVEESLFSRIGIILDRELSASSRCQQILTLILAFAEKNPGLAVLLAGEVLAGEDERLHQRIRQVYDRIETQLRQILREAELREQMRTLKSPTVCANLLMAVVEGRLRQFVRSAFSRSPTEHWPEQWVLLKAPLLRPVPSAADAVTSPELVEHPLEPDAESNGHPAP
ncbi:nucleoid occlusion factor SlmA [Pokkaliibacter sp. CJK22405]|uniref:nucleoid occlusion factor SlmA n=1 Tax=Pokkaliibacter sp. CJK22405 TaxID=3384615 RepID=UPI003984BCA5